MRRPAQLSVVRRVMNQHVIARLRAALPGLTPALARVASHVLAAPDQTLALTITELAEQAGGSESAVIRLCRELGFEGFQDLKLALATEMAANETISDAGGGDAVAHLAALGALALSDTAKLLDRKALARAVERLISARHIHLFGVAASAITCRYLAYKLVRLGLRALLHDDAHLTAMLSATAGKDDVFVIVSSTGSTIDSVVMAQIARKAGCFVIAISNRFRSPLASVSDVVLLASSPETPLTGGAYASKISQLLIVDAIFAQIAAKRPELAAQIAHTAASVSERSF